MLEALTLDQLRIFMTVAAEGGFAAAGRKLGRAQSAISYAIANLEETLGVELFDRSIKRHISLSPAGESLLGDAKRVLGEAERMFERAGAISAGLEPELTLVIDVMFPTPALVSLCAGFSECFAQVRLRVFTEALGAVSARVLQSPHAVGVQGPDGLDEERVRAHPLSNIELIPVVAAHHPLAQLEAPQPEAQLIQHTQLVLTDRSNYTADHARGILCPPERQWSIADLGTKRALIEAGLGWGNLPMHMIHEALERGELIRLEPEPWMKLRWKLPLYAITARGQAIGPAQRWVIEQLERLCEQHLGYSDD